MITRFLKAWWSPTPPAVPPAAPAPAEPIATPPPLVPPVAAAPAPEDPPGADFVDVRQRIRELTHAELLQGADDYFAALTVDSMQCKKPFSDVAHSVHHMQHLALLLRAADLFPGARVLEFGCATGWLSLGLAQMGCDVVGVDIAPSAVRLAQQMRAERRRDSDGQVEFRVYDGLALPAEDASFDRVVCFDAFHHVSDQAFVLGEFARVLRPGGRVAMVEPGPQHSKTAQSQSEMRLYKVIENDVSMREVGRLAQTVGFDVPRMLVHLPQPVEVASEAVQDWARDGMPAADAQALLQSVQAALTNTQVFWLQKGPERKDSRRVDALAGDIEVLGHRVEAGAGGKQFVFEVQVRNTGEGRWLAGGDARGVVRLGIQLLAADGSVLKQDFTRADLPHDLEPGQVAVLQALVPLPEHPAFVLRFDLVSEFLAWFSALGRTTAVEVPGTSLGEPPVAGGSP